MDLSEMGALDAWGLRQTRAQTLMQYTIVLAFWIFAPFLNQSAQSASGVENEGKISHYLTPCKKGGLVERSAKIIRVTPPF